MTTAKQLETAAIAHYEFDPCTNMGEPIPWEELNEHVRMRHRKHAQAVLKAVDLEAAE